MRWGIVLISLCCLLSCGLEAFYYIDYIPDENVTMDRVYNATIRLPGAGADGYSAPSDYFDNFIIFYRIYISGDNPVGTVLTSEQRTAINATLNADFGGILSTTDKTSTTVNTSNLENFFYGRNYYQLTLENAEISDVLSASRSLGRTLEITFPSVPGQRPSLNLGQSEPQYALKRAVSGPSINFRPEPLDRFFLNHEDLYNSEKANDRNINADVATRSATAMPANRYTYVAMYIAAAGRSFETPPRNIYSQPTFIGVFMLPDSF